MKKSRSGRGIAAKRRTGKAPGGKDRVEGSRAGRAAQKVLVPKPRSMGKKRVAVTVTPSSLASILAERVAAAR